MRSLGRFSLSTIIWGIFLLAISSSLAQLQLELIGQSESNACVNIVDETGTSALQCDEASILEFSLTASSGGGSASYLFQNTHQQSSAGGPGSPICNSDNPGTCVGGSPFTMTFSVSKVLLSYSLSTTGIVAPFCYAYGNCLTRGAGYSKSSEPGAYPDVVSDRCGPTVGYNYADFSDCTDETAYSYEMDPDKYSECVFMCGIDKELQTNPTSGPTNPGFCTAESTYNSLSDEYLRTDGIPPRRHLVTKGVDFHSEDFNCVPNFPGPVSLCPCGGGYSTAEPTSQSKVQSGTNYIPVTVCRSGSCAGTCGSALVVGNFDEWCNGQPADQCCNTTDPSNVCANTAQPHRCLKCQPEGSKGDKKHYCYYFDLNVLFRCAWTGPYASPEGLDFSPWCGTGDQVSGGYSDPTYGQDDSLRNRDVRECNCDANFVEKLVPVNPMCVPFNIDPSPRYEYVLTVSFQNQNGTEIPGSYMTVGGGLSPEVEFPGSTILPLNNYTSDGFALTSILGITTPTGKGAPNLPGYIVMCNDGASAACSIDSVNISKVALPTTLMNTSSGDGRTNPWSIFGSEEAMVPLPYQLYQYANANLEDPSLTTGVEDSQDKLWWYYVPPDRMADYGVGCGQIGMFPEGSSNAGTAQRMCNGPQGTCIPGLDTLQKGRIVDPPCNIAADMYAYVRNQGGAYPSQSDRSKSTNSQCLRDRPFQNVRVKPKHVPPDWTVQNPNYWVHNGRLYKDFTPNTPAALINVRVAVAADYQGEVITQAPGYFGSYPQICSVFEDFGTGRVSVTIINEGAETAQYVIKVNCTQGLEMSDPDGVPVSQPPGVGGSNNVIDIPLIMRPDFQAQPTQQQKENGILVPACSAQLFASSVAFAGHPLNYTSPIQCQIQGAAVLFYPDGPPVIPGNGIGQYIPNADSSTCGIMTPVCSFFFGDKSFFTAPMHALITFFMIFMIMMLIALGLTLAVKKLYIIEGEYEAEGMEEKKVLQTAESAVQKSRARTAGSGSK